MVVRLLQNVNAPVDIIVECFSTFFRLTIVQMILTCVTIFKALQKHLQSIQDTKKYKHFRTDLKSITIFCEAYTNATKIQNISRILRFGDIKKLLQCYKKAGMTTHSK